MQIKNIACILDRIVSTGAIIADSATESHIRECSRRLCRLSFPALPSEYKRFLRTANGFAWNGFEFFGTDTVADISTCYKLRDVVTANRELYERAKLPEDMLIIGRFDEDIYVFRQTLKKYLALDSLTSIVIDTYSSFEELLLYTVAPYIPNDDTRI